jgi:hypothetical protein
MNDDDYSIIPMTEGRGKNSKDLYYAHGNIDWTYLINLQVKKVNHKLKFGKKLLGSKMENILIFPENGKIFPVEFTKGVTNLDWEPRILDISEREDDSAYPLTLVKQMKTFPYHTAQEHSKPLESTYFFEDEKFEEILRKSREDFIDTLKEWGVYSKKEKVKLRIRTIINNNPFKYM